MEEIESYHINHESDSGDDHRIDYYIPTNMLDDVESPLHYDAINAPMAQLKNEFDDGSVSSGSEKDEDNQIKVSKKQYTAEKDKSLSSNLMVRPHAPQQLSPEELSSTKKLSHSSKKFSQDMSNMAQDRK
mmetsp:Transcript_3378/g.4158  ORF Transcript_3378/g.4158 Transcript_3378/m.4158 type:complete len:130 (+) Transcript_3378:891-1280(+)